MPLGKILNLIADNAFLSNILRRLVENNFATEKRLVRQYILPSLVEKNQKLLDFGCGTGQLAHLIPTVNYVGVDIFWKHLSHAVLTHPHRHFSLMDGRALAFPANSFDAILVSGVFHHMDEALADEAMKELRRVLKPNGRALILEDIPTRLWWNFPGRVIHAVDMGAFIRPPEAYARLISTYFKIEKAFPVISGVCDYQVFILSAEPVSGDLSLESALLKPLVGVSN